MGCYVQLVSRASHQTIIIRTRSLSGSFFCFISGTGVIVEREREGKTLKRCCPLGKTIAIVRCCFCLSLYATQYATVYFPILSVLFD